MNYYEVLGVSQTATATEIREAYLAKAMQLHPERFPDAADDLLSVVAQAAVAVNTAWNTLSDPDRRASYDASLNSRHPQQPVTKGDGSMSATRIIAEHVWAMERELGWKQSTVLGHEPPSADPPTEAQDVATASGGLNSTFSFPSIQYQGSPIYDPLGPLERIADWVAPQHDGPARSVSVPNLCGLHASEAFYEVAKLDLQIRFVQLSDNPQGDGMIVSQDPVAGSDVRLRQVVTVQVVFEDSTKKLVD